MVMETLEPMTKEAEEMKGKIIVAAVQADLHRNPELDAGSMVVI